MEYISLSSTSGKETKQLTLPSTPSGAQKDKLASLRIFESFPEFDLYLLIFMNNISYSERSITNNQIYVLYNQAYHI
jgi:hypothetical protein